MSRSILLAFFCYDCLTSEESGNHVVEFGKPRGASCNASPDDHTVITLLQRALEWVAFLNIDPLHIRFDLGMKGMKHFTEYLNFLTLSSKPVLTNYSDHPELPSIQRLTVHGIQKAVKITQRDGFHYLANKSLDPFSRLFREDSMSYLRACWLLENLDTTQPQTMYREKIALLKDKVLQHLVSRGPDQKWRFADLMWKMDLMSDKERKSIFKEVFPTTTIGAKRPLQWFLESPDRPYDITHEVLALTLNGGQSLEQGLKEARANRFGKDFFAYTSNILEGLLAHFLETNDALKWDIVCELLECLGLLGLRPRNHELMGRARADIIENGVSSRGAFGFYDEIEKTTRVAKRNPKYDVEIGGNLHTTMVCLNGLLLTSDTSPTFPPGFHRRKQARLLGPGEETTL